MDEFGPGLATHGPLCNFMSPGTADLAHVGCARGMTAVGVRGTCTHASRIRPKAWTSFASGWQRMGLCCNFMSPATADLAHVVSCSWRDGGRRVGHLHACFSHPAQGMAMLTSTLAALPPSVSLLCRMGGTDDQPFLGPAGTAAFICHRSFKARYA